MSLRDFLEKKAELKKEISSKKENFRQKCLDILEEIKALNEERYHELIKVFHSRYDSLNIKKKRLLGFYAQCVSELRKLKDDAHSGLSEVKNVVKSTTKKVANKVSDLATTTIAKAQEPIEKVTKKTVKKTTEEEPKKVAKKTAKKVAKKAPAKKAPAKKAPAKKAPAKAAPKTAKKVAKKTVKKKAK